MTSLWFGQTPQHLGELAVDPAELAVDLVEPAIMVGKPSLDPVEPAIMVGKPSLDPIEAAVMLSKPAVVLSKASLEPGLQPVEPDIVPRDLLQDHGDRVGDRPDVFLQAVDLKLSIGHARSLAVRTDSLTRLR
jgi:hypothetical protein